MDGWVREWKMSSSGEMVGSKRAPFSASTRNFSFNSNGGDEEEGHTIDISDTIGDLALGPQFAPEMTRVPPIGCACPCSLSEIGATRPGATFRVH